MIRIGDVFEITLSENRKAYGQFIEKSDAGPVIVIFKKISNSEDLKIEELKNLGYFFPPVITGLQGAIKLGLWKKIGKMPVKKISPIRFISCSRDLKTGEILEWFLRENNKYYKLGKELPKEYKNYEYDVVWSPYDINWRIENNEVPTPYKNWIENNKW